MIERVVENWLTRVNERQYQFPFCQLLLTKGFRVLHLSSHGPQEQGKDIIALDPTGRPIAYQLKTGNIDLASLRKIHGEIVELVELPIQFPGVPTDQPHRAVLVTNGVLGDTARTAIIGYNKRWAQRGLPELEVVLYQDLVKDFVELHGRFLPTQLKDIEKLLRLYTLNGSAPLPRKEFAEFILDNMPIGELSKRMTTRPPRRKAKRVVPSAKDIGRHLASTALLTSYAVIAFITKGNHWAVFEAWIIFCCHVLAVAERYDLREEVWKDPFDLAYTAARTALAALIEEALTRDNFLEGDWFVDSQVHRARMTIILGLMAVYHLACRIRREANEFHDKMMLFAKAHRQELNLWGESAMPYLVLHGMYLELTEGSNLAEGLWGTLLRSLVERNRFKKDGEKDFALSDPYLEIEESLSYSLEVEQIPEWERIDYHGRAYSLRTLVLMLARRWRRQLLMSNWYGITGTDFIEMYPRPIWGMLLWRSETGDLRITLPKRPQSWSELVRESTTADTNEIPSRLLSRPDFLAAMLTVYPHRLRADPVKVIDDAL